MLLPDIMAMPAVAELRRPTSMAEFPDTVLFVTVACAVRVRNLRRHLRRLYSRICCCLLSWPGAVFVGNSAAIPVS